MWTATTQHFLIPVFGVSFKCRTLFCTVLLSSFPHNIPILNLKKKLGSCALNFLCPANFDLLAIYSAVYYSKYCSHTAPKVIMNFGLVIRLPRENKESLNISFQGGEAIQYCICSETNLVLPK